jgi:hypothetical protein
VTPIKGDVLLVPFVYLSFEDVRRLLKYSLSPLQLSIVLETSAMASNGRDLLPGQSPPLTVITSTDQSGVVLIATALALIFALISLLIRIFIRREFRNDFARDDIVAAVSIVSPFKWSRVAEWWTADGTRYSWRCNPVLFSSKSQKVLGRRSQISRQSISCSCRRYVEVADDRQSRAKLTST